MNSPFIAVYCRSCTESCTKEDCTRGEQRYDMILDTVGNHSMLVYRDVLQPAGILVRIGGGSSGRDQWLGAMLRPMIISIMQPFVSQQLVTFRSDPDEQDLTFLANLMQKGALRSVIDKRYTLSETHAAVGYVETGRARGKVVIVMNEWSAPPMRWQVAFAEFACLARMFSWRRLAITLAGTAALALLLLPDWKGSALVLVTRMVAIGAVALIVFGVLEFWPRQLSPLLPRWLLRLAGAVVAIPTFTFVIYLAGTPSDHPPFWEVRGRLYGFAQLSIGGLVVAMVIALYAVLRQREAEVRAQALAFDLERSEYGTRSSTTHRPPCAPGLCHGVSPVCGTGFRVRCARLPGKTCAAGAPEGNGHAIAGAPARRSAANEHGRARGAVAR